MNAKYTKRIKKLLDDSSYFEIMVSYTRWSGVSQLFDNKLYNGKVISTTSGYISDKKGIELLDKIADYKLFNSKESPLHSKVLYIETKTNGNWLITGSTNFSFFALEKNVEHMVFISDDNPLFEEISKDFRNEFKTIWNQSIPLNKFDIESYDSQFHYLKPQFERIDEVVPRDFQKEAIKNLMQHRNEGKNKAMIVATTGSGKTYLAAFDAKQFNDNLWITKKKRMKLLFVVHNELILYSAKKAFDNVFKGSRKTIILSSQNKNLLDNYDIIFATDRKAYSCLLDLPNNYFDYMIVDETHRAPARIESEVIKHFNPKFLLGLTATPDRMDAKDVYKFFDYNIAYEINLQTALEKDLICNFDYYTVPANDKKITAERIKPYNVMKIAENILNNLKKQKIDIFAMKTIIFVAKIAEANLLADAFNKISEFSSLAITSESKDLDTEEKILQLRSGQIQALIVVNKFNEGVDIPEVDTIVFYRWTESKKIFLQQLGRGLRKVKEKRLRILDFIGYDRKNFSIIDAFGLVLPGDKAEMIKFIKKHTSEDGDPIIVPELRSSTITLDKISAQKFIESVSSQYSASTVAKKSLFGLYEMLNRPPSLKEIHEDESSWDPFNLLQIIKEKSTINLFRNQYENNGIKIPEKELLFISAFQRLSITASTVNQRKKIIELLETGQTSYIGKNWEKWLSGKTTYSIVEYKNIEFAKTENNITRLSFELFDKRVIKEKEYLIEYLKYMIDKNIDTFMQPYKKYMQLEILFMHDANSSRSFKNMAAQIQVDSEKEYIFKINQGDNSTEGYQNKVLFQGEKPILEFYTSTATTKHSKILKEKNVLLHYYIKPLTEDARRYTFLGSFNDYIIKDPLLEDGKSEMIRIHQELPGNYGSLIELL